MMLDWTTLIVTIITSTLGTGVITGFVSFIIYRKANRTIKENEAKTSNLDVEAKNIENDSAQIDLGKKYIESSLQIIELMKQSNKERDNFYETQNKRFNEFEEKLDKLNVKVDNIDERTSRIAKEQTIQKCYLNGELEKYKREHQELIVKIEEETNNK